MREIGCLVEGSWSPQGQVPRAWACYPRRAGMRAGWWLGMPPCGKGKTVPMEGPVGLPPFVGGERAPEMATSCLSLEEGAPT